MTTDDGEMSAKPRIIDLEADKAEEPPLQDDARAENTPPAAGQNRSLLLWLGLLAFGLLAGVWISRSVLSRYLPDDTWQNAQQRIERLEGDNKKLQDQFAAIVNQSDRLASESSRLVTEQDSLASAHKGLETAGADTAVRITALEGSISGLKTELAQMKQQSKSNIVVEQPDTQALTALEGRIAVLEKEITALKTEDKGHDRTALATALSQALTGLQAKIAAGQSYDEEISRIGQLFPAAADLDALKGQAAEGLPNAKQLATELRRQITLLPRPEVDKGDDSYAVRFKALLSRVVTIRSVDDVSWPDIAASAAKQAEAGDLAAALQTIDQQQAAKPAAIAQWQDLVKARLSQEADLQALSSSVASQIAVLIAAGGP